MRLIYCEIDQIVVVCSMLLRELLHHQHRPHHTIHQLCLLKPAPLMTLSLKIMIGKHCCDIHPGQLSLLLFTGR